MRHMPVMRKAAALALAVTAAAAQAEAPYSFAATPGKLPKDVVPTQYAAHLVADVPGNTFRGTQTVDIEVLKTTSVIMLNADNMEIDGASLSGKGLSQLKLTPILDRKQQTLRFELAQPLAPGKYQLALQFRGQITREARGLFYVNYKAGGADKKLIATTMAPTDARRVLPTWDEPAFRARFKLTVDVPGNFKAYSTTPIEKQESLGGGMQRISFGNTPRMPSYLVVLVAGEMERLAGKQDGVDIGIVTTEGKLGSAAFPLAASRDLLHYFNDYFGVPYPLPKLDQIAIPGGFNGAMENWGAIVYNEPTLLVDPKRSPERVKKLSFAINAHELAHQWFGNLVTMAWWDNLWLNEGFASWMAAKATQHFHPEWRPYLSGIAEREYVLNLDARKTTHPIQTPVDNEEQAAAAFDAITYRKGEAFLRMLEAYLGEESFRKGIRAYMAKHQYSNTTSADLWQALEKATGKPVEKLASDWTLQPGFPLVKVEQACENGKRKVTLSQEQYRLDEPATEKRLWNIPVQVGTVNGKAWTMLLSGPSQSFTQASCEGTLVVDPYSVGYFRVQYDPASFQALAAQAPQLRDSTRLKLLTDAWSLVSGGRMQLDGYLKLVESYRDEPRLAVWDSILSNLRTLDTLARGEPEQALIRRFLIGFARPKFDKLGWEEKPGEPVEDGELRGMLATALARAADPQAIAEGKARFARYLENPSSVSPAMIDFVMSTAGRYADAATYEALAARAAAAPNSEERNRFGKALTSAQDPALAARTMKALISPDTPPDIIPYMLFGVAGEHLDQTWAFATANRDALLQNMEALGRYAMFAGIVGSSSDPRHADMMEAYVRKNFGPDAVVEAERIGNGVRIRAAQKERLLPQVRAALK
ncbi:MULTISPECIES: M1 family metallopeptidase [unclassified Massilia]|uniref:M1 family metallopeptidase n=1 Tax=unclassified Massilia TaxID=2609279 RepID=UPI001B822F3C|nr:MULTISPECIES: M1 family metallopeptidase [unclassified Massilia]MBQ5942739.1 M1 family metallopeptidase [Massilia sp. AB1]MBQ5965008.1 M1 family metallopeptidase [Massilia sp. ZL223]